MDTATSTPGRVDGFSLRSAEHRARRQLVIHQHQLRTAKALVSELILSIRWICCLRETSYNRSAVTL